MKPTEKDELKKLRFQVTGRVAELLDTYYSDQLKAIFSYTKPGASFTPAHKQWIRTSLLYKQDPVNNPEPSGWDGKVSLFQNNRIGVGLLLSWRDKLKTLGFKLKIVEWKRRPYIERVKGFRSLDEQYEYQNECVRAMRRSVFRYGGGLVISATGSGKTRIAAQFASGTTSKILFIVDEISLLYQSQREIFDWLKREGRHEKVGVVGNGLFQPERITVATVQTLHLQRNNPRFRLWQRDVGVVIIDEIHTQLARRNFGIVEQIRPQAVIGLTATLQLRKKQVALLAQNICGPEVFKFPISEGVKAGVLSQGVVVQILMPENTDEPNKAVKWGKQGTRMVPDKYEHQVVCNAQLDERILRLVSRAIKEGYATAVLVDRVKHVTRTARKLGAFKPKLLYGHIDKDSRRKALDSFDAGSDDLLVANRVFTKGVNVKRLDLVIDNAQRQSKNDIQQKFGRAVRLHKGKRGSIFFSIVTSPVNDKVAKAHRSAFRSAKTPFVQIHWTDAKTALNVAERLLSKTLKGNK